MSQTIFLQTYGWPMGAVLQTADGSHGIGLDAVGGVRKRYLRASGGGEGLQVALIATDEAKWQG